MLITAASKGLDLEFARQCTEQGLNLVMIARSAKLLNDEALSIQKAYNVETATIPRNL